MFEKLAKATLKIECGTSSGSGFHFYSNELVVTNHHVVEDLFLTGTPVIGRTEDGQAYELTLISYSDKSIYDFALFRVVNAISKDRVILQPKILSNVDRGTEVCFGGYPHGIDDLLIHQAYVSGPFNDLGFYVDGSVNGGNSGGPIIDASDFAIIGLVTQRRFLGAAQLQQISSLASQLQNHCQVIAGGGGGVSIMGIDFTQFAKLMSDSFLISNMIIEANANAGIGIGFHIKFVVDECKKLGIIK